jgi:Uncharacterized protein conserved in bacteria
MILGIAEVPTHAELLAQLEVLRAENARLRGLLGLDRRDRDLATAGWSPTLFAAQPPTLDSRPCVVDRSAPRAAKVAVFRSLFAGRDDVYALRWENQRTGKGGWGPAVRGGWANARRPDREYLPFTDEVTEGHLAGQIHAGLYPLLPGDTCRLLACDFDGPGWVLDALAFSTPPGQPASPPRWNGPAQATAAMCGYSSPARSRRHRRGGSASTSCARR